VTKGEEAERLVIDRLRAALPKDYRVFGNVAWLERTADHRGLRDGEADVVIAHPDRGFLVIEVKAGEIARDAYGRWFAGPKPLNPSPFEQAKTSMHALLRKLDDLPDRPSDFRPISGHAVAFPDVDLASAGNKLRLLGPDVEPGVFERVASQVRPRQPERRSRSVPVDHAPLGLKHNPAKLVGALGQDLAVLSAQYILRLVSGFLYEQIVLLED